MGDLAHVGIVRENGETHACAMYGVGGMKSCLTALTAE